MTIASLPEERWVMKAAGWSPELSTKYNTERAVGRPKKIWEDEINDFLRPEKTEDEISVERNNNEWIKTAKDQDGWKNWKTSSQSRQQHHPALNTREEGERVIGMTPDADTMQSGKMPDSFQTQ